MEQYYKNTHITSIRSQPIVTIPLASKEYEYLYYRYSNLFYIRNIKMNNKYEYPYYSIRIDDLYSIFAYAYSYKYPYYGY